MPPTGQNSTYLNCADFPSHLLTQRILCPPSRQQSVGVIRKQGWIVAPLFERLPDQLDGLGGRLPLNCQQSQLIECFNVIGVRFQEIAKRMFRFSETPRLLMGNTPAEYVLRL